MRTLPVSLAALLVAGCGTLHPATATKATEQPISVNLDGSSPGDKLRITRIAHASVLLQWGDEALLMDPWFSTKSGFPGYYPGEGWAMDLASLPKLTGVLASQDHYDHFDIDTFAGYRDHSVPIVVPAGTPQRDAATKVGFSDVRALKPSQTTQLGSFHVTAISAKPKKGTSSFEYEHAYVIEVGGHAILFVGHMMTEDAQAEVAQRFPKIDLALLAVNGLRVKPQLWHKLSMNPADAAALCRRLNVAVAIPIHYTFTGSWLGNAVLLSYNGNAIEFTEQTRRRSPSTSPVTLAPGQPLELSWGGAQQAATDTSNVRTALVPSFFDKLNVGDMSAFDLFAADFVHHRPLPGAVDHGREQARTGMT
jgi:L-ascorbate metabolism protein UlaG (beta-lactamase superfamily)